MNAQQEVDQSFFLTLAMTRREHGRDMVKPLRQNEIVNGY
jgi:hypothetical protein